MPDPLFSTYTHGENRVTATLVAVLEHVNTRLNEDLLKSTLDESDLSFESDRFVSNTPLKPITRTRTGTVTPSFSQLVNFPPNSFEMANRGNCIPDGFGFVFDRNGSNDSRLILGSKRVKFLLLIGKGLTRSIGN